MWKLVWSESAKRDLQRLDKHIAKIIILKTMATLDNIENLKQYLVPLKHAKKSQYKYRIGNYRVICVLEEKECIILAISLGHRNNIYKR